MCIKHLIDHVADKSIANVRIYREFVAASGARN